MVQWRKVPGRQPEHPVKGSDIHAGDPKEASGCRGGPPGEEVVDAVKNGGDPMNDTIRALGLPDPDAVFPNEYGTSCYIKNVVKAPNIQIGDYTYYDDPADPAGFEQNNVLQILLHRRRDPVHHGPGQPPDQQRQHLSLSGVRRGVGRAGAAPPGPAAPEGGHRGGQRRVDRPGERDPPRGDHWGRGHRGRLLRGHPRRAPLHPGRGQPRPAPEAPV